MNGGIGFMKLGHILIIAVLFLTATIIVSIPSYHPKPSEPKPYSVNSIEINTLPDWVGAVIAIPSNVTIVPPFPPPYHPKPSEPKTYSFNPTKITVIPSNSNTSSQASAVDLTRQDADSKNYGKSIEACQTYTNEDMLNVTTALSAGIKGVIILRMDNSTQIPINIVQSVGKTILLTAKFVPYDKGIAEAILTLNPQGPGGIVVEIGLGDGKGSTIKLNDFVKYSVDHVELPANQIVEITMIINVPVGTPHTTLPLAPVGISSDYPIINNFSGDVNV
jgi:hypothetical protein